MTDSDRIWQSLEDDERKHVILLLFDELALSPAEAGSMLRLKLVLDKPKDVFIPAVRRLRRPKYGLAALTLRQCAALYLTDQQYSTTEIARRWGTRTSNVNVHPMEARCKLRVDSTQAAIELSREHVKSLLPFLPLDGPEAKLPTPEDLTGTERKLLPDIASSDLVYREIAERHGLAENTIKSHAANIAHKLRARGRAELIAQMKRLRLLDDGNDANNEDR